MNKAISESPIITAANDQTMQDEISWRKQEDVLEARRTMQEIREKEVPCENKGCYLFLKRGHPSFEGRLDPVTI